MKEGKAKRRDSTRKLENIWELKGNLKGILLEVTKFLLKLAEVKSQLLSDFTCQVMGQVMTFTCQV
jgi:hypothetical protein